MMGLEDGFGVLDKAAKQGSSSCEAEDFCRGKKLQSSKSLQEMIMITGHDRHNLHRPFLDPPHEFGSGSGDGPTTCTSSCNRPKISNIFDVVVATSGSGGAAAASASVDATTFDISATNSEISHVTAFKSPGGMAASLEFPFTSSQWKELQRQALIYKYMMASLPVPPDLLFPTIRNPSVAAASHCTLGSGLNLGFSGRGRGDLEPGRCRRTDGKKWRCSRDVAPGQKYCERHMHRGRPRSRKPVELPNKKTRQIHTQDLPSSPSTFVLPNSCITASSSPSPFLGNISQPFHQNQTTEFSGESSQKSATFGSMVSIASYKGPRSLEWMMNRESVSMASSHQQLQHLIQQTKIELPNNSPVLNQNCTQELVSLNSYVDFGKDEEINNCHLILNPDMVPMGGKPHENLGRSFIDAWSSDGHYANPGTKTDEKLSMSQLSLTMGGSSIVDDEVGHIHMGLGVNYSNQSQESGAKPHLSSWLAPPSWTAPTPGGPLAEVLRPSKVAHATANTTETSSNPLSPIAKNDDPCSPSVNAMSSPSGVLHRTLASMSDSSGNSSPTLPSSRAKPEISFLWLSQGKSASST